MKKLKILSLSLSFFINYNLFSQTTFGLNVYPHYSHLIISADPEIKSEAELNFIRNFHSKKLSFAAGITVKTAVTEKINLIYGFNYSNIRIRAAKEIDLSHYEIQDAYTGSNNFEFPFSVQQKIFEKDNNAILVTTGITMRYLAQSRLTLIHNNSGIIEKEKGLVFLTKEFNNRFFLPVYIGIQYRKSLENFIEWEIGPTIAFHLESLERTGGVNSRILQLGITNTFWFK